MKRRNIFIIGLVLITALLTGFLGCRPAGYEDVSEEDLQGLRDYVVSSYYILKGNENLSAGLSAGRATVPVHTDPLTSFRSGTKTDYPEIGQTTTWTVEDRGNNVYKITAVTTYDTNDAIEYTEEIYYVKDELDTQDTADTSDDVLGTWGTEDPVVAPDGSVDNLHRDKFITVFKDGSIRYEEIDTNTTHAQAVGADDPVKYAAFEEPADAEIPASEDDVLTTYEDAFYSSKVSYQQEVFKRFAFWNVLNKVIIGTRYYTETGDDYTNPVRTSISYERTVERSSRGLGGIIKLLKEGLYDPSSLDIDDATLAETVIWYKIDTDGDKSIVQKTRVVNDFGDEFYITGEGADADISNAP